MKIYGIDFTSKPSSKKPITCLACDFTDGTLTAQELISWSNFEGFENKLAERGTWIAGIDFPFGLSRRFIENAGWPQGWAAYVRYAQSLGKEGFIQALEDYKRDRPAGDKEHLRATDRQAGSISPQKLYGVPVGKMFFEGAPRLMQSGVNIPGLQDGDDSRVVVEAYPGVLARALIGNRGYKNDTRKKQTLDQHQARLDIFAALHSEAAYRRYGIKIEAPSTIADDPTGDELDTLLCAVQAAWAWSECEHGYGRPPHSDELEGWIAEPMG